MIDLTPMTVLPAPICISDLFKAAFDGKNLNPLRADMMARLQVNPGDAASLMNLSVIDQLLGEQASGIRHQEKAIALQCLYRSYWPSSPAALRVLAFMAPGEIGNNTPIGFLLNGWDVVLYSLYVVPGRPLPELLPDHDIALVTVCEADTNSAVLREIERLITHWPRPVLNRPDRILQLSRDKMYALFRDTPGVLMPRTIRADRSVLAKIGRGSLQLDELDGEVKFPLIARPVDSHAGRGLVKFDTAAGITRYLADYENAEFFISPYIDYRSSDGLFRKYRIIWIDGRAYPCHMAVADHWKVWYYNADMSTNVSRRYEEALFMTAFDDGFGRRHAGPLSAIVEALGLEYMGIDCAESPDGRLLVFEGAVAMAVHNMDSPNLYPYKGPQMRKLFSAFNDLLKQKSMVGMVSV